MINQTWKNTIHSFVQCQIKDGGVVPKSLYRSLEFSEGEESWSSEIYQTAHVSKGSPLEVRCI